MRILRSLLMSFCLLSVLAPAMAAADTQASIYRQLFGTVDSHIAIARKHNADLLSPEYFDKAMKYYKDATESFHMQRNLSDVRDDIARTEQWLGRAMQATDISGITFASVIQSRSRAKSAGAPKFATELWNDAEDEFRDAAHDVEKGDIKHSREAAAKVSGMFQQAELTAIKVNYLSGARNLIKKAEDGKAEKYATKTLVDAKVLLKQAEKELTEDRYDTDRPRDLARRARNEAQHALTITNLAIGVKKKDFTVEDIITNYEKPLSVIAGELNLVPTLHNGYDQTEKEILEKVHALQKDSQELTQARLENADLAKQVASLSEQLGIKADKLAAEERYKALLADIEGIFDPSEAEIFRQGKTMILRMVGLNFDSGKAELKPGHMAMLAKVQRAIEMSNTDLTTIEGHTDSFGGDDSNQKLSEARAQAVVDYLNAHMAEPHAELKAVGYGETRPIANNGTEEGRAKNRRIDVVIQLEK